MQINWESFKTNNQDASGIRIKFENLCRQLFANENLSGNKQFRYLHANPNNYGLETEPIFDETNKRWIGFQAKFFDNAVDYAQIIHSAEETVEHYTGKDGIVDLVFLFCNKPITSTAKGYIDTVSLLKRNNIEIQLITDNAILDLVRNKYPYLGFYYFGNLMLMQEWFVKNATYMFDELGERFNRNFNVETAYSTELSLFLHDQQATDFLNAKKHTLLDNVEELNEKNGYNREFLTALIRAVSKLPDVTPETLYQSFAWEDIVMADIEPFFYELIEVKKSLKKKRDMFYTLSQNHEVLKDRAVKDCKKIESELEKINVLIDLPSGISISDREKRLLRSNVLAVNGKAGTGKSQLLACKTKELLEKNRAALLLVAGIYYSELPIHEQIMSNLRLDCSFEELIDILETIGERDNCIVPIIIDALNETWNKGLWKTELPAIIDKVDKAPMVKLVFSYRTEYETLLLSDAIRDKKQDEAILSIYHRGFADNSGLAVRQFLNHYNIPFTPLEYFGAEMSNPLFLTLYCKTYSGDEASLPSLYERLIEKANKNIFVALNLRSRGYSEGDDILRPLISQMASKMVTNNLRAITKEELVHLEFWDEYGIVAAPFINQLVREEILHNFADENLEYYFFAYDQMNDYYCAKAILDACSDRNDFRNYLSKTILKIENGKLNSFSDIDLFISACALYAERYKEECIDIIDSINNQDDQWEVFSRYISSFQWRDPKYISKELLYELLKKYPCTKDDLWSMLIGNSIKVGHPLNADFLHGFLSKIKLNKRDHLWTLYINDLPLHDEDRLVQLVQMYDHGEKLDHTSEKQIELLLTLFGWLLTSSNRWLRDYTSKAMVEILKEHFHLCIPILERFKDVDDPYVVQRLFGVVFGACCKRNSDGLRELAEYVYESVFNQEEVYPDVLLRDYARLIIEKFFVENPDYRGSITQEKIAPPYNSDPIPEVEDQHYLERDYKGAMFWLLHSMRFKGMGMYGDFGRYVFQSALRNFEIDDKKMFNYAIYHILNDLGYNEKYFGEYDQHCGGYERHRTIKTERIGKKYQWITMHNMLARISDNCKMVDRWNYPSRDSIRFEGAWEPYVRDFDPTLNQSFMVCDEAPIFSALKEHVARGVEENKLSNISDAEAQKKWLEAPGIFFKGLKDTLILTDENDLQWICLTKYCDTGRKNLNIQKLSVWSWLYAYFVMPDQAKAFAECAEKGLSVISHDVSSHHESYRIFNREYPWSPSCREFEEYAWVDATIKTGEFETVTKTVPDLDFSSVEAILRQYQRIADEDEELSSGDDLLTDIEEAAEESEILKVHYKEETHLHEVEKDIGKILHSTTDLIWEEEYDAAKEETITYSLPCANIIKEMGLRQMASDGFFYDLDGKLAAFDTDLTQKVNSVVVRKDVLDAYLAKTGMRLVWLVDAEKEIHAEDYSIAEWSEWEAVFTYEGDQITGSFFRLPQKKQW